MQRKLLLENVRKELRKLKDRDGWVLIHGLPGFGKTVLAAESVRDVRLLHDVFPDGVFWLWMEKMSSGGVVDKSKLLEKLQNFIHRVDKNKSYMYIPSNIEAAADYLQEVMKEQHPRSLLILDDVWESEVARTFSACHCVLATSRNVAVASEVYSTVECVSVSEGFSNEEAKELLSGATKIPPDSLPEEAKDIIHYCMGSPLALGIIAAKLSKLNTNHWKSVVQQLKSRSQVLARVDASIRLSIEELPEESQERFRELVVFASSAVIPSNVLSTFWSMTMSEAEGVMNGKLLSVLK